MPTTRPLHRGGFFMPRVKAARIPPRLTMTAHGLFLRESDLPEVFVPRRLPRLVGIFAGRAVHNAA